MADSAADGQAPSSMRTLTALAHAAWPFRRRIGIAIVLLLLGKLSLIAVPWSLKYVVDSFSAAPPAAVLPVFALIGYAVLRFGGTLFGELRDLVFARVTQQAAADFTLRVFDHLHALDARFHSGRQTGAVARDIERGTAAAAFLLGAALLTIAPTVFEIVAILGIMGAAYPPIFVTAMLATFLVYALVTAQLIDRRVALQRQRSELDSRANARIVDSLLNHETVTASANERYESQRLAGVVEQRRDIGLSTQRALSWLHVSQSSVIAAGVATVMLLAGQRVFAGELTVGDLVLINAYTIQICLPLNTLGFSFREVRDALVNAERMFALLDRRSEIVAPARPQPLTVARGEVCFENVRFGYDAARQVLWDVSFTIAPGGTVAVVGGSGSGKSTLVRLLLRYYDPLSGRILIDGQDIREVAPESLRSRIGIVPQDTVLFDDTIAYNIAYGRPGATMAEVVAAAEAAHVHDFVRGLPDQYETRVGERGLKLSGGEKQRIAIARAILRDPPILILDEATSALDTRSERAIQAELERMSQGRTALIIAHRLSTIVDADEILVLERGRVVERGRYEDLLSRKGMFAQLWALQQKQSEIERTEQRLAMQPLNLATLLAGLVDAMRQELDARGITLYSALDVHSARVSGDPNGLQQALWELMAHAADGVGRGGRIELRLQRAGNRARISVGGTAAAPSEQARLPPLSPVPMDPLRLRSVAESNRGTFEVQAGSGSLPQYALELPLRAVGGSATASVATPAPDALAGVRVLAIDDQREARELLSAVLQTYGAEVETAPSGRKALQALRTRPLPQWPGLLICDISLGEDEDGYAVLGALRALEAEHGVALAQRVPAIALTGLAGAEARVQALLAGFQVHLVKPVMPQELAAAAASLAVRRQTDGSIA